MAENFVIRRASAVGEAKGYMGPVLGSQGYVAVLDVFVSICWLSESVIENTLTNGSFATVVVVLTFLQVALGVAQVVGTFQ